MKTPQIAPLPGMSPLGFKLPAVTVIPCHEFSVPAVTVLAGQREVGDIQFHADCFHTVACLWTGGGNNRDFPDYQSALDYMSALATLAN